MLAETFKVLRAIDWKVEEVSTFTACFATLDLPIGSFVILVEVVTETLG